VPTTPLRTAGAHIHHEVRGEGPLLVLVGSPMGAAFFAPAADLLAADHTVVTLDPRGTGRSTVMALPEQWRHGPVAREALAREREALGA